MKASFPTLPTIRPSNSRQTINTYSATCNPNIETARISCNQACTNPSNVLSLRNKILHSTAAETHRFRRPYQCLVNSALELTHSLHIRWLDNSNLHRASISQTAQQLLHSSSVKSVLMFRCRVLHQFSNQQNSFWGLSLIINLSLL